ncbi:MAG: methyltransferase domain-containing protein [Betaproteobacteria bacterium]|nr:methyltransferase domain-containing protein [Betaproteobacteria bacterium]
MFKDSHCHPVKTCRVCGHDQFHPYLDLGQIPLVNRYVVQEDDRPEPRFPLRIQKCLRCHLSMLDLVVDPEILYNNYAYQSSISKTFQQHCGRLADEAVKLYPDRSLRVWEIASNDGCMGLEFQRRGAKVLGIEPAANLAALARSRGVESVAEFWSEKVARRLHQDHTAPDLIVATNVLAHVDNLHDFLAGVRAVLPAHGRLIVEVPYLVSFIQKTEFDTAYHEHLSYFLLYPIREVARRTGLDLVDVELLEIHGGSVRVHIGLGNPSPKVEQLLQEEERLGFYSDNLYNDFSKHVQQIREELVSFLTGLRQRGRSISAFGASAKGNVLLNYCHLATETFEYVVDDTLAKQGKLCPGLRLPIVSRDALIRSPTDYLVILAWNFYEEIKTSLSGYLAGGGRLVCPLPTLHIN